MLKSFTNIFGFSLKKFRNRTKNMKKEIGALYLAYRRKEIPIYTKLIILLVVGYALSPIDLIPDFVPILGYVDDVIILPLGIALAVKSIPKSIMEECRAEAEKKYSNIKKKSYAFAVLIIAIWVALALYIILKVRALMS
ncbi:YkvA family protein [Clostridium sp. C8-1-8]|uniref:YkvA family protein n=1 Tax=Clostridium sp. C8-1-8 TaxID=2698831 RepID=UPI0013701900|nr:YkvA family protein [Clostridium sp. C8-1-8]